jgi:hypothetical protein
MVRENRETLRLQLDDRVVSINGFLDHLRQFWAEIQNASRVVIDGPRVPFLFTLFEALEMSEIETFVLPQLFDQYCNLVGIHDHYELTNNASISTFATQHLRRLTADQVKILLSKYIAKIFSLAPADLANEGAERMLQLIERSNEYLELVHCIPLRWINRSPIAKLMNFVRRSGQLTDLINNLQVRLACKVRRISVLNVRKGGGEPNQVDFHKLEQWSKKPKDIDSLFTDYSITVVHLTATGFLESSWRDPNVL